MNRPAPPLWQDRREAGQALGHQLLRRGPVPEQALLLALPRGGVAVAVAMAAELQRPVCSWSVRKIADPAWPELAIGAIAGDGLTVWRGDAPARIEAEARRHGWLQQQQRELQRRQHLFGDPPGSSLQGRPLIVVDDGIATGMTVEAALLSLRRFEPSSLTLAVPVLDRCVLALLQPLVQRLEALVVVDGLRAVGEWFRNFDQLRDSDVLELLADQPVPPRRRP